MFELSNTPIDPHSLKTALEGPQSGACVIFEGWVRNHNEGKAVSALEYEAYPELCMREAKTIFSEARGKFSIEDISCVHRTGHLQIGGMAVWLGVTAKHRGSAFEACKCIIDQIKFRLPIWKKEHYQDGSIEWVNCQECAKHGHSHAESVIDFDEKKVYNAYYKRQMVLQGWGYSAQEKLKNSRVLVVGAGGLGCGALPYLAGAGIGHISICDADCVDISNLHRQTLFSYDDIGQSKAELAAEKLRRQNPMVEIKTWHERFSAKNANSLLNDYDLVLDCTDNFATKYLLNDSAWLRGIPLIYAGIYSWEGQIMVFDPKQPEAGCLRCLWPDLPDQSRMGTCTQMGILGAVAGCLGSMQAAEAVKSLQGHIPSPNLSIHDFRTNDILNLKRHRKPDCPLCGDHPKITEINSRNYEFEAKRFDWELETMEHTGFHITDIREPFEIEEPLPDHVLHLPYSKVQTEPECLDPHGNYLFICPKGIKSKMLALSLREKGVSNVFSLYGGSEKHPYRSPYR